MKKWPFILTILFLISFPCPLKVLFGFGDPIGINRDFIITFVIPFPPSSTVEIKAIEPETQSGYFTESFCEGYYTFFFDDLTDDTKLTFKVYATKSNKTPFEFTIEKPSHQGETLYTLDLSKQQVFEGTYPYRTALLVTLRVGIFLALEAFLLWAIGFKQKKNWLILLSTTLITQTPFSIAQVNHMLDFGFPSSIDPLFGLGVIAIIDMILFHFLISDEGNNRRTKLFLISNLLRAFISVMIVF